MMHRVFIVIALVLQCVAACAQEETGQVGVIKVVKKKIERPLPDTGRYRLPMEGAWPDPGFIRGCRGVRYSKKKSGNYFVGVQCFNYTFVQLGIESNMMKDLFFIGFNLEANIDKKIFGSSLFIQRPLCDLKFITTSMGVSGSALLGQGPSRYAAGPYIAFCPAYNGIDNFQVSYGYNYILGKQAGTTNEAKGSSVNMNTHSITLRYRIPFYLYL